MIRRKGCLVCVCVCVCVCVDVSNGRCTSGTHAPSLHEFHCLYKPVHHLTFLSPPSPSQPPTHTRTHLPSFPLTHQTREATLPTRHFPFIPVIVNAHPLPTPTMVSSCLSLPPRVNVRLAQVSHLASSVCNMY